MLRYILILAFFPITQTSSGTPLPDFIVLASKGNIFNQKQDTIRMGSLLYETDKLFLDSSAFISLVHSSGKFFEYHGSGIHELKTLCPKEKKYPHYETNRVQSLIRRNLGFHVSLACPTHLNFDEYTPGFLFPGDTVTVTWSLSGLEKKETGKNYSYSLKYMNIWDEMLDSKISNEHSLAITAIENNQTLIDISVNGFPQYGHLQYYYTSKIPSFLQADTSLASHYILLAAFLEDNNYHGSLDKYYLRAMEKEPGVQDFRDLYNWYCYRKHIHKYHQGIVMNTLTFDVVRPRSFFGISEINGSIRINGFQANVNQELKETDTLLLEAGSIKLRHFTGEIILLDKPGIYSLYDLMRMMDKTTK
ncbi:MAG: hypothetical protein ACJ75J_02265 [Cytophagaceae bacterium]